MGTTYRFVRLLKNHLYPTCHLRIGNDREFLVRICFLHDDDRKRIVIGSLPDHLRSVKVK